jgi:hypothetical protein
MLTRTVRRMGGVGILLGGLVAAVAVGQPPPPPAASVSPLLPSVGLPAGSPQAILIQGSLPVPAAPAVEKPQTVDQLLDELAAVKAQKEELERKEKAIVAALQERLLAQRERLKKLGIEAAKPAAAVAPTATQMPPAAEAPSLPLPDDKLSAPQPTTSTVIDPVVPPPSKPK